jgi:hypothetical protein
VQLAAERDYALANGGIVTKPAQPDAVIKPPLSTDGSDTVDPLPIVNASAHQRTGRRAYSVSEGMCVRTHTTLFRSQSCHGVGGDRTAFAKE